MEDELKEYVYKLEEMNGLLAEELNKHANYVPPHMVDLWTELKEMSENLKDVL